MCRKICLKDICLKDLTMYKIKTPKICRTKVRTFFKGDKIMSDEKFKGEFI